MKKIFLALFILISFSASAQRPLSKLAEISLLSCENGFELYNSYGHSAIRVKDPLTDLDIVFNYGTFDDQVDNFLVRFIRGTVDYTLSMGSYEWFLRSYENENRTVIEQVLNLTAAEKQAVFNRIVKNYETDERFYRYDFFYDNCSSRIHEILKEVLGEDLNYGDDLYENAPETFRMLIDPYMKHSPWAAFGIGIIMGYPTDNIATNKQKMFLPDHLMERFDMATIHEDAFVKSKRVLYKSTPITIHHSFGKSPLFIFSIISIFIIALSIFNLSRNRHWFAIDYALFIITGLAGIFFLFMWFGTRHSPTFQNMNMFWAMPLNLLAIFFIKNSKAKPYFLFMMFLNVLGFFILPQVFHIAVLPIALMMAVRYFIIWKQL